MSTYEISKSSLLSLKAEILKKQDELLKAKTENDIKIKTIKKNTPLELKNKGIESRLNNDLNEEETDLLKLSRSKLEAKSKLYDKLSTGKIRCNDENSKRYLVRFEKKKKQSRLGDLPPSDDEPDAYPKSEDDGAGKEVYEASDPSEEWVEYVDCLGRTRTCLKKDLEYLKSKDESLKRAVDEKQNSDSRLEKPEETNEEHKDDDTETVVSVESELISGEVKREMLRRQWEKEEEELRDRSDIHYQNVLFDEARTHGVGYYAFSKDEEERAKQQEALKKLRSETEQKQKRAQDLKAMREKQLKSRVKAAKNRRRARLGLPPEEDGDEDEIKETEAEVAPSANSEKDKEEAKQKEEEEKQRELKRKEHVRPWDKGKEGVKEHYVYSQEEWVEKKRKERTTEFAPPSTYKKGQKIKYQDEPEDDRLLADYKNLNSSKNTDRKFSSYEPVNDEPKNTLYKTDTSKKLYFTTKKHDDVSNSKNVKIMNRFENATQSTSFRPTPIVNECAEPVEFSESNKTSDRANTSLYDSDEDATFERNKRAEIPPPTTFDYFGPPDIKRPKKNITNNIEQAVEAGLKFLRKQVEKGKNMEPPW